MNAVNEKPSSLNCHVTLDVWGLIQRLVVLEIEVRELRRAAAERQFRGIGQGSQASQSGDGADDDCPF